MGCLPASQMGKASAAAVANEMFTTFPGLHFGLIVGIGGAVPAPNDIRLGDVVVSLPDLGRQHGGVVQYDFGKAMQDGKFIQTGQLNQPSGTVLSGLGKLRSAPERKGNFSRYLDLYKEDSYWDRGTSDHLFKATYNHCEGRPTCEDCDSSHEQARPDRPTLTPRVHYGLIASGDQVMKDASKRDAISRQYNNILCFEMEAAGIMNILPCLVIRGVCDYCDSHKNKSWQPFAAAAAAAWAKDLLDNISPIRSAGRDAVHQQGHGETARDMWLQKFVGHLTIAKRSIDDVRKLIDRISSYEPRRILNRISRRRLPETTEWLTATPAFVEWESGNLNNRTLWLSGKGIDHDCKPKPQGTDNQLCLVGSGKTIAMTTAVHHMMHKMRSHRNAAVVHHFFRYGETTAIDLFCSLSRQIIQIHIDDNKSCSSKLVNNLDMHFGAWNRSPDLDEILEDILLPWTHAFHTLVVCIDGIDMCDAIEQSRVWSGLRRVSEMRESQQRSTRIFMTDENGSKLGTSLPASALRIHLDQGFISRDIELYIDARLDAWVHPRQLFYDTELRARVKTAVLLQAENMFLWVHLQLEEILNNCTNAAEIDATLQDLPKSLQELYMQCLKRKSGGKLVCNPKVLKWCSAARTPLCVDSLRDMLALDRDSGDVDRNKRPDPESVIRSGVSLLTLEEPEMLLEPAHHTVRQFIFSDSLRASLANDVLLPAVTRDQLSVSLHDTDLEIGHLCLCQIEAKTRIDVDRYRAVKAPPVIGMIPRLARVGLRLGRQKTEPPMLPLISTLRVGRPDTASFLQYAIRNWLLHTTHFKETTPAWDSFERVALQPNVTWSLHPWPAMGHTQNSHLRGLLGYAVALNHTPLLQLLVNNPDLLPRKVYDEALPGNDLLPALHVAAKFGYVGLIPMLLRFCWINARCIQHGRTALHVALVYGNDRFASTLCEVPDARFDILDAHGVSPLALALRKDQPITISTLLAGNKVDINSESNGLTNLEHDFCRNFYGMLLGHIDIHSRDQEGFTPLQKAIKRGDTAMTKLLVANQVNVDVKYGDGRTPLHVAILLGLEAILTELLAAGALVNAPDDEGQTPLHSAALSGHEALVGQLLAAKADVNARDNEGRTSLHWATISGHKGIVNQLLASQADVNARDDRGQTSLHRAASYGDAATVSVLLDTSKTEVDLRDKRDQTPLSLAASNGYASIVGQLLATGKVDVNFRDSGGCTPLHDAAFEGHDAVVRLLVYEGQARVDLPSNDGNSRTLSSLVRSGEYGELGRLLREDSSRYVKQRRRRRTVGSIPGARG